MNCSCGQYSIDDPETGVYGMWSGYIGGFYEVHLADYCTREKLPRWRYFLFSPLMRLFVRLAGAHPAGEAARRFYANYRSTVRSSRRKMARASIRKALEAAYDKMTQET